MDYNFVEVMEHFDRICRKYSPYCRIDQCPIAALIRQWEHDNEDEWQENCPFFGYKYPHEFAEAVMKWAKDHPIPEYGTIKDVINEMFKMMGIPEDSFCSYGLDVKINREVAEKFNIQPINGDKINF
jgi:hypothetical protein